MSLYTDLDTIRTKARRGVAQLNSVLFQQAGNWLGWYLLVLIAAALAFQIARPIMMGDTDMWYHLSGGRLLWTQGILPDHPYFSFAYPDREWIAYFWGFQALIYPIFDHFGYQGLIIARAVLFTLSFGLIIAYLYRSNSRSYSWAIVALAIVYLLLLEGRAFQLRPHLVSYAMIPLFLYILEHRQKWLPALPFLTVLWGNLHGVEWVIGATITGAYFIEWSVAYYRGNSDRPALSDMLWLLACLPALMVNPFGWEIFKAPFAIPEGLGPLINELQPISPLAFVNITTSALSIGATTLWTTLMLLTLATGLHGLLHGTLRPSHMIMALAGVALLTKGSRFIYEWALLSLPLAASSVRQLRMMVIDRGKNVMVAILAIALLVIPLHALWGTIPKPLAKYPFNDEGLPAGITSFMKAQGAKGNLLIAPSYGGYVNWALYPDVLIHSDMEFPPFHAIALLEASYALSGNLQALHYLTSRYQVDFVAFEIKHKLRDTMEKEFDYKAVFFDDKFVLYAHQEKQKDIVLNNHLVFIDPHNLLNNKGSIDEQLAELEKIRIQWPSGNRVNHAITHISSNEKRYTQAEEAAERYINVHPEDPNSHYLAGYIKEQQKQYTEAIQHYQKAIELSNTETVKMLMRHIGTCHYLNKDFVAAYDAFIVGSKSQDWASDAETTYQYAYSSIIAGDISGAKRLLEVLIRTTPETKKKLLGDTKALLAKIERGELASPGPLEFLDSLFNTHTVEEKPR